MTSSRKLNANRANARASTGPKSANGKKRSARNAMRLGLSLPVCSDPTLSRDVADLVRLIAGANAEMVALAVPIAEAQIDLIRARQARYAILSGAHGSSDPTSLEDMLRSDAAHGV